MKGMNRMNGHLSGKKKRFTLYGSACPAYAYVGPPRAVLFHPNLRDGKAQRGRDGKGADPARIIETLLL